MIEDSYDIFRQKLEWRDEIVEEGHSKKLREKEYAQNIKMGLTKKCSNCHKAVETCKCIGQREDSTYWGF